MDPNKFLETFTVEGLDGLRAIYAEYDELFKKVNQKHQFGCISQCGACCHTPGHKIEVSLFEMIPLAIELLRNGQAEEIYGTLQNIDTTESVCIHYKQLSADGKSGYCTVHPHRPLICRLFAGGSRIDRNGQRELVLCKPLKEKFAPSPQLLTAVADELPVITDFASRARDLNPSLSHKLVPINEALKLALTLVLTYWQFYEMAAEG